MRTEQRKLLLRLAESLLQEEPIDNYTTVGNWERNSSFGDIDRRLLTNPKAVEKIKAAWNNTPYHFDIYMVNDPRVNKSEFTEVGEVSLGYVRHDLKLDWFEVPAPRPDAITVIYTNNKGAERLMMTGWMMAHRLGHAFYAMRGDVRGQTARMYRNYTDYLEKIAKTILDQVYDKELPSSYDPQRYREKQNILRWFANQLGTMKSAREDNLRTWDEFAHELLAQYLLTGSIEFNPLPNRLITGYGAYGRERAVYAQEPEHDWNALNNHNKSTLAYYAQQIEMTLKDVLNAATGSIFVM